jgi:homoserine kinase type II
MSDQQALQLDEIISNHYHIGALTKYEQLQLGYINLSYIIETGMGGKRGKYFFRRYKEGIKEEEIIYEHSIIRHLKRKGFTLIADVLQTRDDRTYVKRLEGDGGKKVEIFYAVFNFLPGTDKYSWVNPKCTDKEIEAAAAVLAQFHNAVSDLDPAGKRYEPIILDLLPELARYVVHCSKNPGSTIFDDYFQKHLRIILDNLATTQDALGTLDDSSLPRQVIHSDFHPGNLKFRNSEIVGLFDFDWSRVDFRCLDIALAITYFFSSWADQNDGKLHLDNTSQFIKGYQNSLKDVPGIDPLNPTELACLPHMISASNLFVFNWTIRAFYGNNVDPEEYLVYLKHGVNFMKWLAVEENLQKLSKMIAKTAVEVEDENN